MQDFTKLDVWRRSQALALGVYRVTRGYPDDELYGVTSQLRRAAVSICTNIAEGARRDGRRDYARFLNIAQASLSETVCLLLISRELGYLLGEVASQLVARSEELGKMLHTLKKRVEPAQRPD